MLISLLWGEKILCHSITDKKTEAQVACVNVLLVMLLLEF